MHKYVLSLSNWNETCWEVMKGGGGRPFQKQPSTNTWQTPELGGALIRLCRPWHIQIWKFLTPNLSFFSQPWLGLTWLSEMHILHLNPLRSVFHFDFNRAFWEHPFVRHRGNIEFLFGPTHQNLAAHRQFLSVNSDQS